MLHEGLWGGVSITILDPPRSSFEQTWQGSRCYIRSFVEIGPAVLEKILKGFYYIWVWRSSWSCDLNTANKISSPYQRRLHIKFGFDRSYNYGSGGHLGHVT